MRFITLLDLNCKLFFYPHRSATVGELY